jgi:hypothetical protein
LKGAAASASPQKKKPAKKAARPKTWLGATSAKRATPPVIYLLPAKKAKEAELLTK